MKIRIKKPNLKVKINIRKLRILMVSVVTALLLWLLILFICS